MRGLMLSAVGMVVLSAGLGFAQPRVWIADQGNNQEGPANPNNRILEIDPINHKTPPDADGDVIILKTLPSPAWSFLDELTFDDNQRMWCVVKEQSDQHPDGARRIDKDTGVIDIPPGLITIDFPGQAFGGYLEGLAWDGQGLWATAVRDGLSGNMLTRVDPMTGAQIAPFYTGTLTGAGFVNIPGNIAQGALWEPGNGGHGWLWHSDVGNHMIYRLDLARLFDSDPGNDNNLAVASFTVPFPPKGMDWMGDKIWVASPYNGIWQFDPATGATMKLFNTPNWNLDGVAILPEPLGPKIVLNPPSVTASVWVGTGNPPNQVFTVANGGDGHLDYLIHVDASAPWLSVTPHAGSSNGAPNPHTLAFDMASYRAGTYTGTLTVTGNAYNSPQTLAVTVVVETVKPDLDGDADVDQEDFGLFQACLAPAGATLEPQCARMDFNGDVTVGPSDLAVFLSCHSGAGVAASPTCDD